VLCVWRVRVARDLCGWLQIYETKKKLYNDNLMRYHLHISNICSYSALLRYGSFGKQMFMAAYSCPFVRARGDGC
jgi:hypothetical protein